MTPFECYVDYLALKRHFTSEDFSYQKYLGKVRVSQESFTGRKDRIFFDKLSRKSYPHELLLANISIDPNLWIRDIVSNDESERNLERMLRVNQSITRTFQLDLKHISNIEDIESAVKMRDDGSTPSLIRELYREKINRESVCILTSLFPKIMDYWDEKMSVDPSWRDTSMNLKKLTPFLKFDKPSTKKILIDILESR